MIKRFARATLSLAETFYLWANGWELVGKDRWNSPMGYPKAKREVHQGHAVNSMKQYDDNPSHHFPEQFKD